MNGDLLLDSNIVIALFGNEKAAQAQIASTPSIYLPAIALGELYYGAEKSKKTAENVDRIRQFAIATGVLPCDPTTAREYGRIKEALRAKGRPIPENDIWIAAVALQHGLTLATRDQHFREVPGLSVDECR